MRKGATTVKSRLKTMFYIVALRNEKGSYNLLQAHDSHGRIVALRNENGSYNEQIAGCIDGGIIALRNENGSHNGSFLNHWISIFKNSMNFKRGKAGVSKEMPFFLSGFTLVYNAMSRHLWFSCLCGTYRQAYASMRRWRLFWSSWLQTLR